MRSVLELADLIQHRRIPEALALIRRLLDQGESAIGMAAFLGGQLRRMLIAKSLGGAGSVPAKVTQRLGLPPWVAERITAAARRYDQETLERAVTRVAELDAALKSSRLPATALLETYVMELQR